MSEVGKMLSFAATERQIEAVSYYADNVTQEIVYGGAKGGGKSYLGVNCIFGDAFTYPNTKYYIARKELKSLMNHTRGSIHEVFDIWGLSDKFYNFNKNDGIYTLHNKSEVHFLAAEYRPSDPKYMRFGSMQFTRGWIEEAGEFEADAKNNLAMTVGRWKNNEYNLLRKVLMTCNPSKNFLYADYYKPWKMEQLPKTRAFIQSLPTDNPFLPKEYVEAMFRDLPPADRERLCFGNWEYDDDPHSLVSYDAILDCFTTKASKEGRKRISADLAMQGRDRFIVALWHSVNDNSTITAEIVLDKEKATGKSIERDLAGCMDDNGVGRSQCIVDADGLGNYLTSYLHGIKEFRGNEAAKKKGFANYKTQCAYKLAEIINNRKLSIICTAAQKERIIQELEQLKCENTNSDEEKKKIVKKGDIKDKLGRSPDYLDTLIMGMHYLIAGKSSTIIGYSKQI